MDELVEELRAVRRELAQLRRNGVVARLTEAEREEIAQRVLDRLDDRELPLAVDPPADQPPRRRRRGKRYFHDR